MDPMAFWRQLNLRAETMGIHFGPQERMSNSSKAMQAGEFAKAYGRHDAYHEAVFRAFFTDCKDIGDTGVILDIARHIGLDADNLERQLSRGTYLKTLEETTHQAKKRMITSAPTFVIEDYGTITGAQPIEEFRSAFKKLAATKTV